MCPKQIPDINNEMFYCDPNFGKIVFLGDSIDNKPALDRAIVRREGLP